MSKICSCGQSNPVVKHCSAAAACRSMAGYGFKGKFKLVSATPLVTGVTASAPPSVAGWFTSLPTGMSLHLESWLWRHQLSCEAVACMQALVRQDC